jgi:hypothetical protein
MSINPDIKRHSVHVTILDNDSCMEPRVDNMLAIKCLIVLVSCYALFTQYSLIYSSETQYKTQYLWWPKNLSLISNQSVFHKMVFSSMDVFNISISDTS